MAAEPDKTTEEAPARGERIAKALARAGVCSRREAEKLISEGRVVVNGRTVTTPAFFVSEADDVRVDEARVGAAGAPRLWRYHKRDGLVTTHRDPQGRPTVFDALPPALPRVISVGRLDLTTEGLLLLTNHGGLARILELPSTGWTRRYRARAYGRTTQEALDALSEGVEIEGVRYGPVKARLDQVQGGNVWITLSIKEGKNREVRNVMRHLGLTVNRLIRTAYGPFQLGGLKPGEVEETPAKTLREQLGPKLAKEAGF